MRIIVVGSGGQLGEALVAAGRSRGHEVTALNHQALDICDAGAVARRIEGDRPDAVLNAAAYNAVDAAETHAVEALQLNAIAVRHLARAARTVDAAFVHYGTDFIFDGAAAQPYTELDTPNPQSVYAWSKLLGEWFASDARRSYVLRVESLFGTATGTLGKGSVAGIVRALTSGGEAPVFEDRTVSPTHVGDAAEATCSLLEGHAPSGIYHCVNTGSCTWLAFAEEAARILGVPPRLKPVRFADVKLPAARPKYSVLSNAKLKTAGISMPPWNEALRSYVQNLKI